MIIGMIPARYASTRFPGKPLALIAGRPMILHVLEAASRAKRLDALHVLTDDERIARTVMDAGGSAIMTDPELPSGTDRIAAAMVNLPGDIFVNIQGDEPLMEAAVIDTTVEALLNNPQAGVATPVRVTGRIEDILSSNTAKVVVNQRSEAIYFSRAPIPFARDVASADLNPDNFWLHVGLYVYRRRVLQQFGRLQSNLEQQEKLEQLRFIENGITVLTVPVDYSPLGVDTPDDIRQVEELLRQKDLRATGE